MEYCQELTKKPNMSEARPCIRQKGHTGKHVPNLTGLHMHGYYIISIAPPQNRNTRWYVQDRLGNRGCILNYSLMNGLSKGKKTIRGSGQGACDKNGKSRPEYATVRSHHNHIFKQKKSAYVGMPFYDEWNPDKGGLFALGAKWIVDNLGCRPSSHHSLDIIEHRKGFVPGNLRWTLTQSQNQKHKTMFLLTLEQHAEALRQLGYGIHKLTASSESEGQGLC